MNVYASYNLSHSHTALEQQKNASIAPMNGSGDPGLSSTMSTTTTNGRSRSGSKSSIALSGYRGLPLQRQGSSASNSNFSSNGQGSASQGWRASGIPSPTAGLGITSSSYMAARTSPIGPPPREALPSLPDSAYEDAVEPTSPTSFGGGYLNGMQAMAHSRPSTVLWEGQQQGTDTATAQQQPQRQAIHPYAYTSSRKDDDSTLHAGSTRSSGLPLSRRTMGSSPPQAGPYTRQSVYSKQAAEQVQQPSTSQHRQPISGDEHRTNLPQRSALPFNRAQNAAMQTGISPPRVQHHSDSPIRERDASTSTLLPSVSSSSSSTAARERTRSAATTATSASGTTTTTTTAADHLPSKSVLTIALQKAQSAVLLDSAQNEEAAIAAYMQSVRLLKEVMARVEESAGTWRVKELEKLNALSSRRRDRRRRRRRQEASDASGRSGASGISGTSFFPGSNSMDGLDFDDDDEEEGDESSEDDETEEERRERMRREAKLEKREKMRLDESRRLKVIHDTYEERIRVLSADIEERARVEQLSAEASARTAAHTTQPHYMLPSRLSSSSERSQDSARAGVGSAMLSAAPLSPAPAPNHTASRNSSTTPLQISAVPFPDSPTYAKRQSQLLQQLDLNQQRTAPPTLPLPDIQPLSLTSSTFGSISNFRQTPEIPAKSEKRKSRTESLGGRNMEKSVLSFSPDSDSSQVAVFESQQQHQQQTLPDSPESSSRSHRIKPSTASSVRSKASPGSSSIAQFSSTIPASSHRQGEDDDANDTEELYQEARMSAGGDGNEDEEHDEGPSELATPTPDTAFSTGFGARNRKTSSSTASMKQGNDPTRSRAGSQASSTTGYSSLRHMTSNESLSSTSSSVFGTGNWANNAAQKMPLPPLPNGILSTAVAGAPAQTTVSSTGKRTSAVPHNVTTRQMRSASLANTMQPGSVRPAASLAPKGSLLVNPSTSQGTISQRRKSPYSTDSALSDGEDDSGIHLPRTGSTEGAGNAGAFDSSASLPMRLRALSQPGSKRPGLQSYNSEYAQIPAVPSLPVAPTMIRAGSDPTNRSPEQTLHDPMTPASADSFGADSQQGSPPPIPVPWSNGKPGENPSPLSALAHDDSATGPSLSQILAPAAHSFMEPDTPLYPSFMSATTPAPSIAAFAGSATFSLAPSKNEYHQPPADITRRPFHFLKQLRSSIQTGAYLTQRLYIPKQLWQQGSIKLIHIETKVRMLDLLLNGLEAIERLGDMLLLDSQIKAGNASSRIDAANKLARELDSFEGMLDGVQSTLSKKLGYIEAPGGKKGGQSSFGAWSSKLSRSMDRMTKGKNLDAPETYVAAIARLCLHVQILDRHVLSLHAVSLPSSQAMSKTASSQSTIHPKTSSPPKGAGMQSGYSDLSPEMRRHVESKLKRASEFFEKTICTMILADLGIWLEKYSKRAAGWATD